MKKNKLYQKNFKAAKFGKKKLTRGIDPKNIGVPNICFSLTNKDDEREKKFKKQRVEFGFDDSETWSLDVTIAKFILPRLKRLYELRKVKIKNRDGFNKKIRHMIQAFEIISNDVGPYNEKDLKKVLRGMKAFSKNLGGLWW